MLIDLLGRTLFLELPRKGLDASVTVRNRASVTLVFTPVSKNDCTLVQQINFKRCKVQGIKHHCKVKVMIIKVKVRDAVINISCGNGRQTFRWLGSVIQSRIKQYGLLKNRFEDENYIVTEIRNRDNQLLNPADLLVEHAEGSNLEVIAIVASSFPVDEWEIPEMGDWLKGAHIKSKIGSQWMSEIEAWRDSLKTMKDATNRGGHESHVLLHRAQPQTSNFIQIGFDFTESDIDSAFDLDWSVMKWDWLHPSELQKNQLGDVLKQNYASVCNLFAHYCGVGQGNRP